jgi:hypothetical protein
MRFVTLVLMLAVWAPAAAAGPVTFVSTHARTRGPVSTPDHVDNHFKASDTGGLVVESSFSQAGANTASADAAAELGFLRGQTFVAFQPFADGDARAVSEAAWLDDFLVDMAGHTGEQALIQMSAWVHGFVDITGDALATVTVQAQTGSLFQNGPGVIVNPFGEFRPGLPADPVADGHFTFNEPFLIETLITLGTPFRFGLTMVTETRQFTGFGAGSADIQMGSTITWNGITGLSIAGVPVDPNAYTFSSASGLDYRNSFLGRGPSDPDPPAPSVPEPLLSVLMGGGAALAGLRRRRRSTRCS